LFSLKSALKDKDIAKNIYSYYVWESIKINKLKAYEKKTNNKIENMEIKFLENLSQMLVQSISIKNILKIIRNNYFSKIKSALIQYGYKTIDIRAKLISRGLFGIGSPFGRNIYEVGLFLDTFLNVPYIPGSEIKGAIRSAWRVLQENKMFSGYNELENIIFGSPEQIGATIFFDAYPIDISRSEGNYLIIPDVISPHYAGEDEKAIHEAKAMPIPIQFLVVAPSTVFEFIIGIRYDVFKTREILKEAIRRLGAATYLAFSRGIGAKTMVGYTRFAIENIEINLSNKGGRE